MSCYERKLIETQEDDGDTVNGEALHHTKTNNESSTSNVATGRLVDIDDANNLENVESVDVKKGSDERGDGQVVKKKNERGGRMKSVGVLCHSYHELASHFAFLRTQVQ